MEQTEQTENETQGGIIYDPVILGSLDTKQLLIQQIARQDLFFPRRSHNLKVKEVKQKMVDEATKFIEDLDALGAPNLVNSLTAVLESFMKGGEV